jgi:NAD+ diphosphatase
LRPDHSFLSQALKHPSASFLVFNKLEPLIKSPSEPVYLKYADIKPIIGEDPFHKTEEDLIKEYNSEIYNPQIIFLGLDERQKGDNVFGYKDRYKGQPYWALDITPQKSAKEAAEALIKEVEAKGLNFSKGRMNLSLPAQEGSAPSLSVPKLPR